MSTAADTRPVPDVTAARVPAPCGPLTEAVFDYFATGGPAPTPPESPDPGSRDLQLALYCLYELHYRGFAGVDEDLEWDPALLAFRGALESAFLADVRAKVADLGELPDDPAAEMDALSVEPVTGTGPSWFLAEEATWEQMREYFVHRSVYHLKEADPHAWVIPRLQGQAKASFVAVEFDEYGGGRGENVHQQLWADLMAAADLDPGYLAYLDRIPAETLPTVNVMSLFGLRRSMRGATLGHFAATEITSPPGSARLVRGLERLGAPAECVRFYAEHVEADAVHEQVMRHDVVGEFVRREPDRAADVVLGMRALAVTEDAAADQIMAAWADGRSALQPPH